MKMVTKQVKKIDTGKYVLDGKTVQLDGIVVSS